jgi:serine/threonine protein kinase
MHEIIKGITSCHENKICHRDLKLENILIDREDKQIKVIDFGLSDKVDPVKGIEGYLGTVEYLAPEVAIKSGSYNEKCDMWSLGVIMYALFTKKFPFTDPKRDTFKIKKRII